MMLKKTIITILLMCANIFAFNDSDVILNSRFSVSTLQTLEENSSNEFQGNLENNTHYNRGDLTNVDFSGLCDYVSFETADSGVSFNTRNYSLSGDFSVSMWINMSSTQISPATLFDIEDNYGNSVFKITTESLSSLRAQGFSFYLKNNSNNTTRRFLDSGAAFDKAKWVQLVISVKPNSGEVFLYVNGSLYKEISVDAGSFSNLLSLVWLGRSIDGTSGLVGSMDEIKIIKIALTTQDVFNLYQNEKIYNDYNGNKVQCLTRTCTFKFTQGTSPLSDIFGKTVFTKKTMYYECVSELRERGSCAVVSKDINYTIPDNNFTASYITTFAGGRLEEIASIASAQSFASKIMSGWHGYCIKGLQQDFSWASDPYFWGSLALSTAASYIGGTGATDVATKTTTETAKAATKETLKKAAEKELYKKMAQYAICAAGAGLDFGEMQDMFKEVPCDPVDEMCDDEENESADNQIYTLSEQEYNDMLTESPEYEKYIKVKDISDGQVSYSIVFPPVDDSLDTAEAEAAKKAAQEKMKEIQTYMIAATAAVCAGSVALGDSGSSPDANSDGEAGISAADGASALASVAANAMCGPLCSAGVQVIFKIGTSFKNVNTCDNDEDAVDAGSRHDATYKALKMNLCKFVKTECITDALVGGGCQLHAYHYCCYDTVLTKVLASQVKAQLASNWAHCTGITLNEMMNLSFKNCEDTSGIDGTTLSADADYSVRKQAFQHTDECIDYTEYISYIIALTGNRFDENDINDLIENNN